MGRNKDEVMRDTTNEYLDTLDPDNPPSPADIQKGILDAVETSFAIENGIRAKYAQWRIPDRLAPSQIADIILRLHPIACIAYGGLDSDPEYDVLALYQHDGKDAGTYSPNTKVIRNLVRQYCYTLSDRETQYTVALLRDKAPRVERNTQRNLIAVNNGIFDYDRKELMPFSKDLVFVAKSHVDYDPNADNPVIHNDEDGTDWDVETWLRELFDDQEVTDLIWEIIGAIIRPNVKWNKSAWLYSNTGNNGKGTLCELMRQITGEGACASIPLSAFGNDFMLEPLLRASAIVTDENNVGEYIDKAANLKAIITNDVIPMNRKFKDPITYRFRGFMVQCLNEMPRIKDKSDSFYRRQLFVPFTKCFTGATREYIKDDYLKRGDVLRYVLKRVLHMDYYELSEPEACRLMLDEYKDFNDPVRQFVDEVLPECKWDLLPYTFLYELYKEWFKQASPSGTVSGRNTFVLDIQKAIFGNDTWYPSPPGATVRTGHKMDAAEPLIAAYHLDAWMNPAYRGTDIDKLCHPRLKTHYRGLRRYESATNDDNDAADGTEDAA